MRGIQEVKKTPVSTCLNFTVPRLDPEVRLQGPQHSQGTNPTHLDGSRSTNHGRLMPLMSLPLSPARSRAFPYFLLPNVSKIGKNHGKEPSVARRCGHRLFWYVFWAYILPLPLFLYLSVYLSLRFPSRISIWLTMDSWHWDVQAVDGNQSKYNLLYFALKLEENWFANFNFLLIDTHLSTNDVPVVWVN